MTDSAVPLEDVGTEVPAPAARPVEKKQYKTLYLRLDTMGGKQDKRVRAILRMFPGELNTVLFYADTRQRVGTRCLMDPLLLEELMARLGQENVVLK